jgi:hypothetical protein
MGTLVSVSRAAEQSIYQAAHIRQLLRKKFIRGEKQGGIWLVDPESLKEYEKRVEEEGSKKFDPTKYKGKD